MNFLYPLFLAGAATAALPILIHILTRKNRKTVIFSDLKLLQRIDADESPRYKFENLILMILRAVICLILALLFAQPVFNPGHGILRRPGQGTAAALILDSSGSMGASEGGVVRYETARERALEILDQLRGEDEAMAIFASTNTKASHATPSPYREEVRDAIQASDFSPYASSFTSAVQLAIDALLKSPMSNREIYFFTDGQREAFRARPASWPPGAETINAYFGYLPKEEQRSLPNVELSRIDVRPLSAKPGDSFQVEIEVAPHGEGLPVNLKMQLETGPNHQLYREIPIVSGQPAKVAFNLTRSQDPVDTGIIKLQPDVLDSDNVGRYALPLLRPLRMVMSQGGGPPESLLFLQNALTILARQPFIPSLKADVSEFWEMTNVISQETVDVVMVTTPGRLDNRWMGSLTSWMRDGGNLFITIGSAPTNVINTQLVPNWAPVELKKWKVDRNNSSNPVSLDFDNPWMDRFENQEEANWQGVNVWEGWEFDTGSSGMEGIRPLIMLDRGSPLLWQREIGLGTLSVWMSSLDDSWNDLPHRGLFLSFWGEFLRSFAERKGLSPAFEAGAQIPIEVVRFDDRPTELRINRPDDSTDILAVAGPKLTQTLYFSRTDVVGIYEIEFNEARIQRISPPRFAVNVEPGEGNLAGMSAEEIDEIFPFSIQSFKTDEPLTTQLIHARFGYMLWPAALFLIVCLMFLEARLGRPV